MSSRTFGGSHKLRASYVWHDEVMADVVIDEPAPVTLGASPATTFVTPESLGLPERYAVLRPGQTGYVLTLSTRMRGKISLQGREMDVSTFVAGGEGGARGSFRATAVSPGDWGVIQLDESGIHVLFFQFVAPDPPIPRSGWRDSELLLPAVALSVFLHAAFLVYAFWYYKDDGSGFTFPGGRELVAGYLVNRPAYQEEPEEDQPKAGTEEGEEKIEASSTAGKEARKGGEGEKPRKKAPDPDQGEPDEPLPKSIRRGLLADRTRETLRKQAARGGFDDKLGKATARLQGLADSGGLLGYGGGTGTGIGEGHGTGTTRRGGMGGVGGGGKAHADVETRGRIETGGVRAARGLPSGEGVKETEVSVKTGRAAGNLGGLTHAQILKVIKSRKSAIKNCYERQLQRQKGLGGKIVVRWKIVADGGVKGAKVRTTSMRNGRVEDCIVRQISRLRFPKPKGGVTAVVNFPFIFAER